MQQNVQVSALDKVHHSTTYLTNACLHLLLALAGVATWTAVRAIAHMYYKVHTPVVCPNDVPL